MDEAAVMARRSGHVWVYPATDPSTRPLSGSQPGDGAHMHEHEAPDESVETQRRAPFGFTCRREASWC